MASPAIPATRLGAWLLRSRIGAAVNVLIIVAGIVLLAIAALDSVVSWPADRVLITPAGLVAFAGFVIIPGWLWMGGSYTAIVGLNRRRMRPIPLGCWRGRTLVVLAATAVLALAVVIVGFVIGGAKGSLRVLPGPVYQVSTLNLNDADWTTVSSAQYQVWQARFVREDAILATFAVVLIAGCGNLFNMRGARGLTQAEMQEHPTT
jgi:hypothetical protein